MESDRPVVPDEEPRSPASGREPRQGSLLPLDADEESRQAGGSGPLDCADRPDTLEADRRVPNVAARQTRDLNDVVHRILVIGLVVSTVLLLIGLIPDLILNRSLPTAALPPAAAVQRSLQLHPGGFLSLGLLVLLFTPVLRVVGSIFVFLWERDWLYFGVTILVFAIMLISIVVGKV